MGKHHFGYRRIVRIIPPTAPGRKPRRRIVRLVPCPVERAIAGELCHWVLVSGEPLASVCRDFQRRGLPDSEGKPYADGPNGRSGEDTLRRMLQRVFREKHAEVPKRLGMRGMRAYLGRELGGNGQRRAGRSSLDESASNHARRARSTAEVDWVAEAPAAWGVAIRSVLDEARLDSNPHFKTAGHLWVDDLVVARQYIGPTNRADK